MCILCVLLPKWSLRRFCFFLVVESVWGTGGGGVGGHVFLGIYFVAFLLHLDFKSLGSFVNTSAFYPLP